MQPFLYSFFTVTSPTEIYTLSLHDALPISTSFGPGRHPLRAIEEALPRERARAPTRQASLAATRSSTTSAVDRKSTRLNSSHLGISYAVFCLKKKTRKKRENSHCIVSTRPQ